MYSLFLPLPLFLSLSFSLSSVRLFFSPGKPTFHHDYACYVRAYTFENGRPFISHPTDERTLTNRTLPRAKTSNRTRPSVQRKRGERALRRGGAGRGETKKSFRIKTGKQKNNQISAYIINEDMCVRACVLATAPVKGGVWTAEKVLTSIGIRRADACHRPPPPAPLPVHPSPHPLPLPPLPLLPPPLLNICEFNVANVNLSSRANHATRHASHTLHVDARPA